MTMVLHTEGSKVYFDDHLINLLKLNENDEFRRVLEDYQKSEPSLTISRLMDSSQATLLHYAAQYGNVCIVEYLINLKSNIDAQDMYGRSPLMLGIGAERDDVVRVLLRANANIHVTNFLGDNLLQLILERKVTDSNMIDILLKEVPLDEILKGITLDDLRKKLRKTIVKWEHAVYLDNAELLRVLLDRKKVHISITDGTLLHLAIKWQKFQSVKVLLEYGADVDALDYHNAMPIRYLYCHRLNQCSETLETMKILVSRMTMLTSSADDDRMQICDIMKYGDADTIEIIMQSNVDLNATDRTGNTVMHYMALNGNPGVFTIIRGRHFDANVHNNDGYIPLHYAVTKKSLEAVKFFLENGANVNDANNRFARTPLYFAFHTAKNFNKQVVELLLRYGADPQMFATNASRNCTWTVFDLIFDTASAYDFEEHLKRAEPVLAHLAIIKALGIDITEYTRSRIAQQSLWVKYFYMCIRQVEQISDTVVYGDMTVLEFLMSKKKKILAYVRNEEFVTELERIIASFEDNSPYPDLLRKRLAEAMHLVELQEMTIATIGRIFGSKNNVHYLAAQYVIAYLNYQEMENLCSAFGSRI